MSDQEIATLDEQPAPPAKQKLPPMVDSDPERNLGGRPEFVPTKEQISAVIAMVAAHIAKKDMAKIIGVDRKTFRRAFTKELRYARLRVRASVVGNLIKQTEKSTPATIFYLCNDDPQHWSNSHMMTRSFAQPIGGNASEEMTKRRTLTVSLTEEEKLA